MIPLELRREIRQLAGAHSTMPIDVVPGDAEPTIEGESWHYTTRTGRPVRYPSAYAKVGWSSLVYVPSTRRLIVGEGWIAAVTAAQTIAAALRGDVAAIDEIAAAVNDQRTEAA